MAKSASRKPPRGPSGRRRGVPWRKWLGRDHFVVFPESQAQKRVECYAAAELIRADPPVGHCTEAPGKEVEEDRRFVIGPGTRCAATCRDTAETQRMLFPTQCLNFALDGTRLFAESDP